MSKKLPAIKPKVHITERFRVLCNSYQEVIKERNQLRAFLEDAHAYTAWALRNPAFPLVQVCASLGHDIGGVLNDVQSFSPRIHGWAKKFPIQ